MEIKDQLIVRLNTEESANIDKSTRNIYTKNFSDCKKQNSKKNFLINFLETEKFEYDRKNSFLDKINKNSSLKNISSFKKLNFFENEVSLYLFFLFSNNFQIFFLIILSFSQLWFFIFYFQLESAFAIIYIFNLLFPLSKFELVLFLWTLNWLVFFFIIPSVKWNYIINLIQNKIKILYFE